MPAPGGATKELDFRADHLGHSDRQKSVVTNTSSHDLLEEWMVAFTHTYSLARLYYFGWKWLILPVNSQVAGFQNGIVIKEGGVLLVTLDFGER